MQTNLIRTESREVVVWGIGAGRVDGSQRGKRKLLGVGGCIILIVAMVSWVIIYIKVNQILYFKCMCLVFVN